MTHFPIYVPGHSELQPLRPSFNPVAVASPLRAMILQPKSCWSAFRRDPTKFHQLFERQVFLLAALPPVFAGIGYSVFGDMAVSTVLLRAVAGYFASILFIYLAALFAHKTAEMFAGRDDIDISGKLVIYSLMPFYVASIFLVHPTLAPLCLFGAFGAYQFTQGASAMTNVPPGKIPIYCCVNIVAWIFVLDRLTSALFG
ncbi:MAG: Yip1 family protein [Bdellovibrionota bacterium]